MNAQRTTLDHVLAISRTGGRAAMKFYRPRPTAGAATELVAETKLIGAEVVSRADQLSDRRMSKLGLRLLPDYEQVTEENAALHANVGKARILVNDSIDGTSIFLKDILRPRGLRRMGWGNTVCTVENGVTQVAVIHQPAMRELFYAVAGEGCFRVAGAEYREYMKTGAVPTGKRFFINQCVPAGHLDETGPYAIGNPMSGKMNADALQAYIDLIKRFHAAKVLANSCAFGCAVANAFELLFSGMHCYLNIGGGTIWDLAAPSLCIIEAGGVATDLDGKGLVWNKLVTPVFWAVNEGVARKLQPLLK